MISYLIEFCHTSTHVIAHTSSKGFNPIRINQSPPILGNYSVFFLIARWPDQTEETAHLLTEWSSGIFLLKHCLEYQTCETTTRRLTEVLSSSIVDGE